MTMTTADRILLIKEVRQLALTREHKLDPRQLNKLDTLTEKSLLAMRTYLDGRPERGGAAPAAPITAQIRHATEMAQAAADAHQPRRSEPRQGSHRHRRPGSPVTEEGIYYYDGKVYKAYQSQYPPFRWQAKLLDPARKTDRWSYAQGMMGVLRAGDKMTAEQSIEYERLYGHPVCTDCGAPLENDLSRARRKGPVCYGKNGPNPGYEIDSVDSEAG